MTTATDFWTKIQCDPVEMSRVASELRKCIESFDYYMENYVYILDRQKQAKVKWHHWPCHRQFVKAVQSNKFTIILKARQLGISWMSVAYGLWLTTLHYGSTVAVFSQREEEASDLLNRAEFIYNNLPPFLQPGVKKRNETEFSFNDVESGFKAYPAKGNAGRSQSATLVICDEWAHHPEAEEQWSAMLPIINEGDAKFVGVSTANGAGNFFHSTWQAASEGENDFTPLFFSWRARPDRDEEWYERTRKNMKRELFLQEYPNTPQDAFRQTGSPFFDAEFLKITALYSTPIPFSQLPPDIQLDSSIQVFMLPKAGRKYCIGVDIAEGEPGVTKTDATDITIVDWEANTEVLHLNGRWRVDRQGEMINALARFYTPSVVGIERNGIGVAVIKKCEDLSTPGLYRDTPLLRKPGEPERPGKYGWVTSGFNKSVMLEDLEEALRMGYHRVASQKFIDQATVFQYLGGDKYGAPRGFFDDAVMSRAIALQMRKHIRQAPVVGSRVSKRSPAFVQVA